MWKKNRRLFDFDHCLEQPFSFGRAEYIRLLFFPCVFISNTTEKNDFISIFIDYVGGVATKANAFGALVSECELILICSSLVVTPGILVMLLVSLSLPLWFFLNFFSSLTIFFRISFTARDFSIWLKRIEKYPMRKPKKRTTQKYGMSINMRTQQ